jgi:predicted Zn-dependent protease
MRFRDVMTNPQATPNKRLAMLESMVKSGKADSFAFYALALEYRKEARLDDALGTFADLRKRDPDYLPMYLMAGQIYVSAARYTEARDWLEAGLRLAQAKGDSKAFGELQAELAQVKG